MRSYPSRRGRGVSTAELTGLDGAIGGVAAAIRVATPVAVDGLAVDFDGAHLAGVEVDGAGEAKTAFGEVTARGMTSMAPTTQSLRAGGCRQSGYAGTRRYVRGSGFRASRRTASWQVFTGLLGGEAAAVHAAIVAICRGRSRGRFGGGL